MQRENYTDFVAGSRNHQTCLIPYSSARRTVSVIFVDINECASNPCVNGASCSDEVNAFSCSCAAGYTGDRCETGLLKITFVSR